MSIDQRTRLNRDIRAMPRDEIFESLQTATLDPSLDLEPRLLETRTGDLTVHCSDTLHKSHRPKDRPRKVVYSGFRLPSRPGDVVRKVSQREQRAARARLTNVRDRIDASESRD